MPLGAIIGQTPRKHTQVDGEQQQIILIQPWDEGRLFPHRRGDGDLCHKLSCSLPAWVMMKTVIELSCHSGGLSHKSPITCLLHLQKLRTAHLSQRGRDGMWWGARGRIQLLCQCGFPITHRIRMHTFYTSAVLQNQKKCSVKSDEQPGLICAGLSFSFSALGMIIADAVTLLVPRAEIWLISLSSSSNPQSHGARPSIQRH